MSEKSTPHQSNRVDWATVIAAEREYIDARRTKTDSGAPLRSVGSPLTGLAFSGGGIRSAVFCLGVMQALAKAGILGRFDYLSTVSGGGYIGSSLSWFTRPGAKSKPGHSFGTDADHLPYGLDDPNSMAQISSTHLLTHLRRHGSYLNPSGEMSLMSGIAVVLRGLVLNLLVIWLTLVTLGVTLVRLGYRLLRDGLAAKGIDWIQPWMAPALALVAFAAVAIGYSLYTGICAYSKGEVTYSFRRFFEIKAPVIVYVLVGLGLVASLPYAGMLIGTGKLGTISAAGGAIMGLWSRLASRSDASKGLPSWIGPVAAVLVLYGLLLLGFTLSDFMFEGSSSSLEPQRILILVVCSVVAAGIGWFVDLNETTLHRFYRDRLMEAFMPDLLEDIAARSKGGRPDSDKAVVADKGHLHDIRKVATPTGPYHLLCAHLVLTHFDIADITDDMLEPQAAKHNVEDTKQRMLARWRIRGGDSFVFAPFYSGGRAVGWLDTAKNETLKKLTLATAMAISGAAVNPNAASSGMGPQRNRAFAVLMALLNLRLGFWLPNPSRYGAPGKRVPAPNHFTAGVAGVLDRLRPTGMFLEIADGGHFENLGVYELLRRRVNVIVACDATADPGSAFADLQSLLSLAEADFGVKIIFKDPPLDSLLPRAAELAKQRFPLDAKFSTAPFLEAEIHYPDGKGGSTKGKLYYIKPSIFSGLRLNVLGFKGSSPDFPNDSTANQFFDEARFEAYRELGFFCVEEMLKDAATNDDKKTIKEVLEAM